MLANRWGPHSDESIPKCRRVLLYQQRNPLPVGADGSAGHQRAIPVRVGSRGDCRLGIPFSDLGCEVEPTRIATSMLAFDVHLPGLRLDDLDGRFAYIFDRSPQHREV